MASQENTTAVLMLDKGEMVNKNLMTMFLVVSIERLLKGNVYYSYLFRFLFSDLPNYSANIKYHKMDVRIIECLNILKIVSFMFVWVFFTIISAVLLQCFAYSRCPNI